MLALGLFTPLLTFSSLFICFINFNFHKFNFYFLGQQQAGNTEENTYYMVMEEGQLNQLNSSQTYYIDESHLSNGGNGGYSKVVLAENPEMQPVSGVSPEVVASNVDSTEAAIM